MKVHRALTLIRAALFRKRMFRQAGFVRTDLISFRKLALSKMEVQRALTLKRAALFWKLMFFQIRMQAILGRVD
jgi:hypothetical protein